MSDNRHSLAAIEARVREFIVQSLLFGDRNVPLGPTDSLQQLGLIDSTTIVELVTFIEQEFGVRVEEPELTPWNFETIAGLVAFVANKTVR